MGRWQLQVLPGKPEDVRSRRRARNPRLRVHSHRRHQDSHQRVVWRRYAVRRDNWQPAVSDHGWRWRNERLADLRPLRSTSHAIGAEILSMVIPSRWMAGGRGLGEFRAEFLSDRRVRTLVDYENAKDVFPTVGIGGGICYFLWDRDKPGLCDRISPKWRDDRAVPRTLDEFDVFVRDERSVDILHKILAAGERPFESLSAEIHRSVWRPTSRTMRRDVVPRHGRSGSMPTWVQQESAAPCPGK